MGEIRFGPFSGGLITAIDPSLLQEHQAQEAENVETRHGILEGLLNLGSQITANLMAGGLPAGAKSFFWNGRGEWRATTSLYDRSCDHGTSTTYRTAFNLAAPGRPRMAFCATDPEDETKNKVFNYLMGVDAPTDFEVAAVEDVSGEINFVTLKDFCFGITYVSKLENGVEIESNPLNLGPVPTYNLPNKGKFTITGALPTDPDELAKITAIRIYRTKSDENPDGPLFFLREIAKADWTGTYTHGAPAGTGDAVTDTFSEPQDESRFIHWGVGARASDAVVAKEAFEKAQADGTFRNPYFDEDHSIPPALTCMADSIHAAAGDGAGDDGILFGANGNIVMWCYTGRHEYWPAMNYHTLPDFVESLISWGGEMLAFTQREIYAFSGTNHEALSVSKSAASFGVKAQCGKTVCRTPYGIMFLAEQGLALYTGTDAKIISDNVIDRDFWDGLKIDADNTVSAAFHKGKYILFHAKGTLVLDFHNGIEGMSATMSNIVAQGCHITGMKKLTGTEAERETYFTDPRLFVLVEDNGPKIKEWGDALISEEPETLKPFTLIDATTIAPERGDVMTAFEMSNGMLYVVSHYQPDIYTHFVYLTRILGGVIQEVTDIGPIVSNPNQSPTFCEWKGDLIMVFSGVSGPTLRRWVGGAFANPVDYSFNSVKYGDTSVAIQTPIVHGKHTVSDGILISSITAGLFVGYLNHETRKVEGAGGGDITLVASDRAYPTGYGPEAWVAVDPVTGDYIVLYAGMFGSWDIVGAEYRRHRASDLSPVWIMPLLPLCRAERPKFVQVDEMGRIWSVFSDGGWARQDFDLIAVQPGDIGADLVTQPQVVANTTLGGGGIVGLVCDDLSGRIWWASDYSKYLGYQDYVELGDGMTFETGEDFNYKALVLGHGGDVLTSLVKQTNVIGGFIHRFRLVEAGNGYWRWRTGDHACGYPDRQKVFKRVRILKTGNLILEVLVDGISRMVTTLNDKPNNIPFQVWLPHGTVGQTISLRVFGGACKINSLGVEFTPLGG